MGKRNLPLLVPKVEVDGHQQGQYGFGKETNRFSLTKISLETLASWDCAGYNLAPNH